MHFSPQIGCWYLLAGTNVYLSATLLERHLSLPESSFENSQVALHIVCILLKVIMQLKISPPIGHWSYWKMLSVDTKLKIWLALHLLVSASRVRAGWANRTCSSNRSKAPLKCKGLLGFLPIFPFSPYKEPLDVCDWLHCPNAEILTTFLDWGPKERKLKPILSSQLKTPLALISLTWGISPRCLS